MHLTVQEIRKEWVVFLCFDMFYFLIEAADIVIKLPWQSFK